MLWASMVWCCSEGLRRRKQWIKGDRGGPAKNPPMLKLVFVFQKLRNSQLFWNSENLTLFCLDVSLYSRPYSSYLFGQRPIICVDFEGSDSTPTIAVAVRIISLIFYNCHSDEEEFCSCFKIVMHGLNYKPLQTTPSPEIS